MRFGQRRLKPRLFVVYALVAGVYWLAAPTGLSLFLGAALMIGGEVLRIWATGHLNKNEELTVTGPYAYLRHPLYAGTLLIATGIVVGAASATAWVLYAVLLLGFFGYYMPYKERIESARLQERYADAYLRYALCVPILIPRLRPYRPLEAERSTSDSWRSPRFEDNNELGTASVVALAILAMALRYALG